MTAQNESRPVPRSGSYLLEETGAGRIFTPEDFSDSTRRMADTAQKFTDTEVIPIERELETLPERRMRELMEKAAACGFFMTDIPEEYGGLDLPKVDSMILAEKLAGNADFSVTFGAHVGIGTLPIVYYGTDAQKQKYLPKSASGEWLGAYALSEPGSGSDALGARTTAVLNEAGTHYVFNGTKQWISNAAWADFFIVFAKVNGELFTAFIVDRDTPGFSTGHEEKKMGLKGSSTRPLIFDNAMVPAENVLGEIGLGHKIAFNILNVGRFKLGCGTTGGSKRVLRDALLYAADRKQFNTPIIQFGALRQKVAHMASKIYAMESICYRIAGYMDENEAQLDKKSPLFNEKRLAIIEEYAIEDSISKVYCSEALSYVVDECLQMYGGYGFVADYPVEKAYRDVRVNRIFEGTNEINRIIIATTILKKAQRNELPLMSGVSAVVQKSSTPQSLPPKDDASPLVQQRFITSRLKDVTLLMFGLAGMRFGKEIKDQQEILLALADMATACYVSDSVVVRTQQNVAHRGTVAMAAQLAATRLIVAQAAEEVTTLARRLACSTSSDPTTVWKQIENLLPPLATDTVAESRIVADGVVNAGGYNLSRY